MLVLALLVSLASPNQCQCGSLLVSNPRWCWLGLTCKTMMLTLSGYMLVRFCKSFKSAFMFRPQTLCLTSLYSFHVVQAACKPFSQLPSCSAWFLNGTTSLCATEHARSWSVTRRTLRMKLLHTQEADNCYSQSISYELFQYLDPSPEVQTGTKKIYG